MQVNRSLSPVSHHTQLDGAHNTEASGIEPTKNAAKSDLRKRITQRSEESLMRLRLHGNSTQKDLADAAYRTLRNDLFMENPAREIPVRQFGVGTTLNQREGILLANFMPHDGALKLVALCFRPHRFFESEAGGMDKVLLDDARDLPPVDIMHDQRLANLPDTQALRDEKQTETGASAHAAEPEPAPLSQEEAAAAEHKQQADMDAARANIMKMDRDFNSTPMYEHMVNSLAEKSIAQGDYKDMSKARLAAHATLAKGKVRVEANALGNKIKSPFSAAGRELRGHMPDSIKRMMNKPAPIPTPPIAPQGPQFKFDKDEFVNFYEDHWLTVNEPMGKLAKDKAKPVQGRETTPPPAATAPALPSRRQGLLGSDNLIRQLNDELYKGRRGARVIDPDTAKALNLQLNEARASSGTPTMAARQTLLTASEGADASNVQRDSEASSITPSQLSGLRQRLPQQ